MSWSVSGSGPAGQVREKIKADGAALSYVEGEEGKIKDAALALIDQSLAATDPEKNVTVSAGGHAETVDSKQVKNNLSMSIY
jgi:hypothetical protein